MHIAGLQRLLRASTGVGAGDDDGLQRFTECSLNGRLPAFVDLDQVEQRAQDTVDARQMLCTSASAGAFQRLVQRLGTGLPPRRLLGGHLAGSDHRVVRRVSSDTPRLGGLDIGNQRCLGGLSRLALGTQPFALTLQPFGLLLQRFDACALAIRSCSDNFDILSVLEKKLIFRLLRELLESKPDTSVTVLNEVLGLPAKKLRELQKA